MARHQPGSGLILDYKRCTRSAYIRTTTHIHPPPHILTTATIGIPTPSTPPGCELLDSPHSSRQRGSRTAPYRCTALAPLRPEWPALSPTFTLALPMHLPQR
ncbi:hypothetical protein COCCADRAFT_1179 [Bipolaris zeicola 26-R-13]|uniref:Uncharacterized protein n=1 Tax=Cochliobolus carbonum (strain 26-R-13) TaxID=930089 RepID=W6YJV2_COCC2|nr:uncharacterized protein COCCADRAFT_1179 [Bipolaris zeicola 26-R-13]EUC37938.1 hypothetical protein COCCADRAFT_1179 [Bipolaris zeicola 26-R-13]